VTIIGSAQIEYMLREKYTESDLGRYSGATDRWFDVLRLNGTICGFLRTSRSNEERFKLEEIYLTQTVRGRGFGRLLLERAESLARQQGCKVLFLYVNRANAGSIATYRRNGFVVTESKIFDIGHGFVMDDYLMEKPLAA
jgi:ribosomal protein S18 acetylase RimI-like enzyme